MKNFEAPVKVKSTGKHDCVEWGGKRWYHTQHYFVDRTGKLLHRAIYESVRGPIPEGYQVHHKDENKTNNDPSNLVALSPSDHMKQHELRGAAAPDFDKRIGAMAMWEQRKPKEHSCAECGSNFESTCTRARFCSPKCSAKYSYHKVRGRRP